MKHPLLLLMMLLLLAAPAMADIDIFTIRPLYGSPTNYLIDYGELTTASVYNYSIESSTTLIANQTWLLLASNKQDTVDEKDSQVNIGFTATILQNFTVAIPGYYKIYYLVFSDGFYDPSTVLTLTMYSNTITTPSPYMTVTPVPIVGIPMLPAGKKESPPYQWVSDNLIWIVIVLLILVGWLVMRRR